MTKVPAFLQYYLYQISRFTSRLNFQCFFQRNYARFSLMRLCENAHFSESPPKHYNNLRNQALSDSSFKMFRTKCLRACPNNRVVMRPSPVPYGTGRAKTCPPMAEFEAKAAGQKCSPEVVCSTLRTFLADNAGIGLHLGIERVIWIGSKAVARRGCRICQS
jgi:hypothetical protein